MSDVPTATKIAALEDHVLRLLSENVRLTNEATDLRERLDSTRQSIITACTGSGCLNAHELRVSLDRERDRCGVLEREVKAWHAAEHLRKDEWHAEFGELVEARWNTARTHALDAAKFVGGGQ